MEERIQKLIDELIMNPNSFAYSIGVSPDTIYNILKGKTRNLTPELARKIVNKYPKINRDWLIKGEGNMYLMKVERTDDWKDKYIANLEEQIKELRSVNAFYLKIIDEWTKNGDKKTGK